MYLCVMPYRCNENLAVDEILQSRTFRVVASPFYAIIAQALSFYLLWKIVGDLKFALVMWFGMRIFALMGKHDSKLLDPHAATSDTDDTTMITTTP